MGRHSKKRRHTRRTAAFKKSLVWGILIAAAVPGVLSTAVLYDHVRQSWDGLAADTAPSNSCGSGLHSHLLRSSPNRSKKKRSSHSSRRRRRRNSRRRRKHNR